MVQKSYTFITKIKLCLEKLHFHCKNHMLHTKITKYSEKYLSSSWKGGGAEKSRFYSKLLCKNRNKKITHANYWPSGAEKLHFHYKNHTVLRKVTLSLKKSQSAQKNNYPRARGGVVQKNHKLSQISM